MTCLCHTSNSFTLKSLQLKPEQFADLKAGNSAPVVSSSANGASNLNVASTPALTADLLQVGVNQSRTQLTDSLAASLAYQSRGADFQKDFATNQSYLHDLNSSPLAQVLSNIDFPGQQAAKDNQLGGSDVENLQKFLAERGYDCGPAGADGKYGKDTHFALKAFLRDQQQGSGGRNTLEGMAEPKLVASHQTGAESAPSGAKGDSATSAALLGLGSGWGLAKGGELLARGSKSLAQSSNSLRRVGDSLYFSAFRVNPSKSSGTSKVLENMLLKGTKVADTGADAAAGASTAVGATGKALSTAARYVGPAIAVGTAAYEVGTIATNDSLTAGEKVEKGSGAVGAAAGAWVLASQGATLGASVGVLGGPVGVAVGGVVGGIAGGLAGSWVGREVGEAAGTAINWVTGN